MIKNKNKIKNPKCGEKDNVTNDHFLDERERFIMLQ
jgi:hypothetical protein